MKQIAVNAVMTFTKGFKRSWHLLNSKCGSARLFVPLHEQDHSGQCPWLVNNKHLRAWINRSGPKKQEDLGSLMSLIFDGYFTWYSILILRITFLLHFDAIIIRPFYGHK